MISDGLTFIRYVGDHMANNSWSARLLDWMRGRNGSDELGTFAVSVSFVLLLVNFFSGIRWLSLLALIAAVYACWRMSSTNIAARRAENRKFLSLLGPLAAKAGHPRETVREMHDYKHLSCPNCGQRVRVPRGKGKIRITCPSCQNKFDAQS